MKIRILDIRISRCCINTFGNLYEFHIMLFKKINGNSSVSIFYVLIFNNRTPLPIHRQCKVSIYSTNKCIIATISFK